MSVDSGHLSAALSAQSEALGSCDEVLDGCIVDECCDAGDSCGYADDGVCDCADQSWDAADCAM